MQLSVITQPT